MGEGVVRQATPSECVTIARQYIDRALEKSREGWSTDEVEALVRSARHWLPTALTEWTERLEAAEAAVGRVRALGDEWERLADETGGLLAIPAVSAIQDLRQNLEGRESHAEAPGSADRGAGGVDGRSEGPEGRSGGMG